MLNNDMDIKAFLKEIMKEVVKESLPTKLTGDRQSNSKKSSVDAQKEFISIKEVSEISGYSVSTLYGLVSRRAIPFVKRKGSKFLRFRQSEILEWMAGKDVD